MDIRTTFKDFRNINEKLHAYRYALGIIYFDSATVAPRESHEPRGRAMSVLSAADYDIRTSEKTAEIVSFLYENRESLTPQERREVEEFRRSSEYVASIPKDEYVEFTVLINDAESVWRKAKPANDFASFAPYLQRIFDMSRRFAGYYKPHMAPYDVMLDMYEKGLTMETADKFFAALRERIVPLIGKIAAVPQLNDSCIKGHFPIYKQREFSDYLMEIMCMDKNHTAIAETEHPFSINFSKKDVRVTTHYHEEDLASSMYSVIHENGHALYELGGGDEYEYTCISGGVSMGIQESQSRLFENMIGRSEAFTALIFPKLRELFPKEFENVSPREFYLAVNKSVPSLIRTEADELTYALHVMVRYELEKDLIGGELEAKDLPQAWNAKYKEYLDIDVPDDTRGVLQDSHWSGGSVGYFPSYALGSAYAAQIMAKMRETVDVDGAIKSGSLRPIVDWLTEHIFRHSSMFDPAVLLEKCCGAPFDPSFYTDYLEEKFGTLYNV